MILRQRPKSVTLAAAIYLAVGLVGFFAHIKELAPGNPSHQDAVWVELTEAIAVLCGVFLWKGHNWARWLALAWMVFHVVLSYFNSLGEMAVHSAFLVLIVWCLFQPAARRYFQKAANGAQDERGRQ